MVVAGPELLGLGQEDRDSSCTIHSWTESRLKADRETESQRNVIQILSATLNLILTSLG